MVLWLIRVIEGEPMSVQKIPPPNVPELPDIVLLVTVTFAVLGGDVKDKWIPPPSPPELPRMILLAMVSESHSTEAIPHQSRLSVMVLSVIVGKLQNAHRIPPPRLSVMVLLSIVGEEAEKQQIPPPSLAALPVIVHLKIVGEEKPVQ